MSSLTTRDLVLAALFTALMSLTAVVAIPLGPVPFTLQVMTVLLAGMVLGPRLGLLSVAAYLCLGLAAPVYAGGATGMGVLIGPTAGYLWAFVPAVVLTGRLCRRGECSTVRLLCAGLAGLVPIYVLGVSWLAHQQRLPLEVALLGGVLQFLPFDAAKALMAALAARSLASLPLGLPGLQDR